MTADISPPTSAAAASYGPATLVPRINVHAFASTAQSEEALRSAFADRRLARAHASVQGGGIAAAVTFFESQPSPNLLIVESADPRDSMLAGLGSLAEVCQPETKVVVIGHVNDVILYRELIRQGVSEYVVAPVSPLSLIEAVVGLYRNEKSTAVGRVIAFAGAKGGTGSSTMAHNCAWEFARAAGTETTIVDLDIAYGTAALDFNLDASGGILEALSQPARVDQLLLERLLVKLTDKLSLLGGPGGVDRDFAIEPHAIETVLTLLRASMPMVVLDIPSVWAPWVRFALLNADHVVLTAEPELASLRNTRALLDVLKAARPNDPPPSVVLNRVGVPKRPEIAAADFRKAIGVDLAATIPFEPQSFGAALNNGKMVLDLAPRSKASEALRTLAGGMSADRAAPKPAAPPRSILAKFRKLGKS